MSIVIVTQNQYIVASRIHHISLDEHSSTHDGSVDGLPQSFREKYYQITVVYSPDNVNTGHNQTRGDEHRECSVIIRRAKDAHLLFKGVIDQIRQQVPDQLFLDKAIQQMLEGADMEEIEAKDHYSNYEDMKKKVAPNAHTSSKKVRLLRKTKRGSKAVLRKSKKRR